MKKFTWFLLAFIFSTLALTAVYPMSALAALSESDRQEFLNRNIETNGGFENGLAGWAASGGAAALVTSGSNLITGNRTGSFDASATSQTFSAASVTIPVGMYAQNGIAQCKFMTAATDYQLQVYDGTNVLSQVTIPASTTPKVTATTFVFPASGSIRLRINSQSNAAIVYIDDCFLGINPSANPINQATLYGAVIFPGVVNCDWSRTANATFGSFSADTDCTLPAGSNQIANGLAPSTKIPAIQITSMPPGEYEIIATGLFQSAAAGNCSWRFSDGTITTSPQVGGGGATNSVNNTMIMGHMSVTTTATRTIEIQATGTTNVACDIFNTTAADMALQISVYRFPSASQTAINPSQSPSFWSGYHDNTCSWARTNAAYGDPTADATCALVQRQNVNFGTVTTYTVTNAEPGIVFTPTVAGVYWVCARPKIAGATLGATLDARLWDGTTVVTESQTVQAVATDAYEMNLCGLYSASSVAAVTLSLQTRATSGAVTIAAGSTNISAVEWSIAQISNSTNAPLLVGSYTTNDVASTWRHESATLANGGASCTVTQQSGTWVASGVRNGAGDCTWTLTSGIFSGTPNCQCGSSAGTPANNVSCSFKTSTPITSTTIRTVTNAGGSNSDQPVYLTCDGPH